jgi:hypothetical protein
MLNIITHFLFLSVSFALRGRRKVREPLWHLHDVLCEVDRPSPPLSIHLAVGSTCSDPCYFSFSGVSSLGPLRFPRLQQFSRFLRLTQQQLYFATLAPGQTMAALSQRLYSISGRRLYGTFTALCSPRDSAQTLGRGIVPTKTMSTTSAPVRRTEPFPVGDILLGSSGRSYSVEEILRERRKPMLCVYRARYVLSRNCRLFHYAGTNDSGGKPRKVSKGRLTLSKTSWKTVLNTSKNYKSHFRRLPTFAPWSTPF